MKYALIDAEIHKHDSETAMFLPLTLEEAQHVVDVMNSFSETTSLQKTGTEKLEAIAALVASVQNDHPLERT